MPLDVRGCPGESPILRDAYCEWKKNLTAKGYGSCWRNWVLALEVAPAISLWLPSYDDLDLLTQITKHDCDSACREESLRRAASFKARIHIDQQDDYSRMSYKIIQSKETSSLSEVPVNKPIRASLLRSRYGKTALMLSDDLDIPPFATLKWEDADLKFISQSGRKVFFKHVSGVLPTNGILTISHVAVTANEIGAEFSRFWAKMWLRDDRDEQFHEDTWHDFKELLTDTELPVIPQITYPFHCVDTWMKIIRSLPTGKAIGPCGWSNDELKCLPAICIRDLSGIFQWIASKGFSKNFMMAKTVLLAKVPVPQSMNHARPITILSCLYRVFGRFIFRHTAAVWRRYLPFSISGGLPGRGVKELAFAQKRAIEDAVSDGSAIGGFSLDLVKAYNTFGRRAVAMIMIRLGMPQCVIEAWISSLDVMVRYPSINGQVTSGIHSTTGVPEGCSISVLSMLATSTLYYYRLCSPCIKPFAYADNWSWMSLQQRAHFETYQRMLTLVSALRLSIDHKKSWHWGTTKSFRESFLALQDLHVNTDVEVAVKSCVKDLGELVHYNKSASIGFIKDKIEDGIHRIQRIEWLPCDLQKKALFIQTSVWPYALYSCDTTYIGQRHFEKLRRACVNTLVGHWHNASPLLACSFLSKFLMDPFLYTLCQCARIIRRLSNVQPEVAAQTIAFAVSYQGSRPYGPASALKMYLYQVGWELQNDGNVIGPDHMQCNLLNDPVRRIVNTFRAMWAHHLVISLDRKGFGEYLPDLRIGVRVFSKCPDEVQQLVRLNVVGGYQTQSMKAKWDAEVTDKCAFCGSCDTREHRLLECSVGEEIRAAHTEAIQVLQTHRPEWVYLPLPRQQEFCLLLRSYLKLVKPPIIPACDATAKGTLRFFTDGGALHPTCASARIASWSVIQDSAKSDSERRDAAAFLHDCAPKFPCFRVVALGIVHGDQTVARGELLAMLTAARVAIKYDPPGEAIFVTDAKYACNIVRLICNGLWKPLLHKLPNCDLISQLADIWDAERFCIQKIKSHRTFESAVDFDDLWKIAGNFCADLAATSAFKTVPPDILKLSEDIMRHSKSEEAMLSKVLDYMASFNRHRCEMINKLPSSDEGFTTTMQVPKCPPRASNGLFPSDLMGSDIIPFLKSFNPEQYVSLPLDECDDSIFSICLQGANIAKTVWIWLSLLKWPPDVDVENSTDWGISWFELTVSFYLCTGFRFPLRISGAGNKSVYVEYG